MASQSNNAELLGLFLEETAEQLSLLEQETVKLERDPTQDRLQIMFRAAHTIKGASRAMGFDRLAELTHEMENLLDMLRNDQLHVNSDIADTLLTCLDMLSAMQESVAGGHGDAVELGDLVERLKTHGGPPDVAVAETPNPRAFTGFTPEHWDEVEAARVRSEDPVLEIACTIMQDCGMKFVRAFMAITAINERGSVLFTIPGEDALEREDFETSFTMIAQTAAPTDDIEKALRNISEIEGVAISTVGDAPKSAPILERPAAEPGKASEAQASTLGPEAKKQETTTGQTVRVDIARLDSLMNLVGELVIDRTRVAQIGSSLAAKYEYDELIEGLAEASGHIARITEQLQNEMLKVRMLPIEMVFSRLPRVVRDIAQKTGCKVDLAIEGGETELDRSIIEVLGDPLLHILRNAVDHGIELPDERRAAGKPEQGTIHLSACHEENHIVVRIEDDGHGIDVEQLKTKAVDRGQISQETADRMSPKDACNLIFASGLSTAKEVTDISGRGVGMDIVRTNMEKLGGMIDVDSELGKGSKFTLRLPLTLAIIRGLLVQVSGTTIVIPVGSVVETLAVPPDDVCRVGSSPVIDLRGATVPLIRLDQFFQLPGQENTGSLYVVIAGQAEQRFGLVVDKLIGDQEVVIKSLNRYLGDVTGISGATILGNGKVALIMDVASVAREVALAA